MREQSSKKRDLMALLDAGDADIEAGRTKPLTKKLLREVAERGARLAEERKAAKA